MKQVDMSEQAVLSRLRTVEKLRFLCLKLMKAKMKSDTNKENQSEEKNDRNNTK